MYVFYAHILYKITIKGMIIFVTVKSKKVIVLSLTLQIRNITFSLALYLFFSVTNWKRLYFLIYT